MSGSAVPGKLGADGRHGRRLPVVGDASGQSARHRSPRGASHRPCIMDPVSPSTELPVAGGVAVPVGQRLHPLLQPRPLHDVGGERRGRHGYGCSTVDPSSRRRVLSSIAVLTVGGGEVVMRKKRKPIGRRAALGPQKAFALISAWSPPTKATSLVLHASSDV
ncbi:hypothetical protein IG631_19209 [Alternaria alternata]|nr:hypothetical protein IG631_19209 [Alternaria alternata]